MPLWREHCPFHVNRSKLHGRGVFTRMDLEYGWSFDCPSYKSGTPIPRYDAYGLEIKEEVSPHTVVVDGVDYELYNPYTFLNHSDMPNAELWFTEDGFQLELLYDVETGEEITINYTED